MPQYVRPSTVIVTNQTNSDGHIKITLELNINLTTSGSVSPSSSEVRVDPVVTVKKEEDKVKFEIPDFSVGEMIDFGKKV